MKQMPTISIDIDTSQQAIYLSGDVDDLKRNRFAWQYVSNYLNPRIDSERIIIPMGQDDAVSMLIKVSDMLKKYGFSEVQGVTSERILIDFREEERKFTKFSNKALLIRNNECDVVEFSDFTNVLASTMSNRTLYPLQLLSAYHLAFSQNACNFSVPGAGKTSVVYSAYAYLHNLPVTDSKFVDRLLIVGPLSSFGPWEYEYAECFGHRPLSKRLSGALSKFEKQNYLLSLNTAELTFVSYQSLLSLSDDVCFFLRQNKVMVVLDEAHKIKNSSGGAIAQAVLNLAKYSKARVVLTGTPAPNGYEDLYNIFKFIWPTKNVIGFQINQLRDMSSRSGDERVKRLIDNISPYFIRIKKNDLNIPPATLHPAIHVPMNPIQKQIYDYIEKKYITAILEEDDIDISNRFKASFAQARIMRLMQAASDPAMLKYPLKEFFTGENTSILYDGVDNSNVLKSIMDYEKYETPSKFEATKNLVEKIIDNGEKVIIWAIFIHTIHRIKDYLTANGIDCQELYGEIPIENEGTIDENESQNITREKIIKEFHRSDSPYKVIIANPFAVSESISLHKACHNAIYIERSFNAAHFVQSKDRIHRYGLKPATHTHYYFILSQHTIDETIDMRLSEKEQRMNEIMESMPIPLFDNVVSEFGTEDIKALIHDYVRRTKGY